MKTKILIPAIAFAIYFPTLFLNSCSTTNNIISAKTGAQLWGENCQRCHNTPDPVTYTDDQWEAVSMHMQIRANLTQDEITKIREFLQSAN